MESIKRKDLVLVNSLYSRYYETYNVLGNATVEESEQLSEVKRKLKRIADEFSKRYSGAYGPFETSVSSGNPVGRSGSLNNVWSGIFKGAVNKQYAAQISFVIDRDEACLNVGFYFGRASGRSRTLDLDGKAELERQLNILGVSLSDAILSDESFRNKYHALFDFGFKSFSRAKEVSPNDWPEIVRNVTPNSQIIARVFPNDFDIIDISTLDLFVSQVIFLMGGIRINYRPKDPIPLRPPTPEQRAKQAERLAEIGLKGELFVMAQELKRLKELGIRDSNYPRHVALDSNNFGYDILSIDETGREIFIEVKTTTRRKEDQNSRMFFISTHEIQVFTDNEENYKLFRVYDVEGTPCFDLLDRKELKLTPDGYIAKY